MNSDLKKLSAYLDNALSARARRRLAARLAADARLRRMLADLEQTRAVLRRAPRRAAPRNLTLSRAMAGVRPPVPRQAVWAQSLALVALLVLAVNVLVLPAGQMSANAPEMPLAVEEYRAESSDVAADAPAEAPMAAAPLAEGAAADTPAPSKLAPSATPVPAVPPPDVRTPEPARPALTMPVVLWLLAVAGMLTSLWLRWRVRRRFYERTPD